MSMPTKPGIVFAHGLWADGSCSSTYEADSSHVIMLSNPGVVTDVIRTAANSVPGS